MKKLAAILSGFLFATAAAGETPLPADIKRYIYLPSVAPIPRNCYPREDEVRLFVLSDSGVLPVMEANDISEFSGYFDLIGVFLSDTDNSGRPEAFGFGTVRSDMGGGFPSWMWIGNFDLRIGEYSQNFSQGIILDRSKRGDGLPTLVIALSEWLCTIFSSPNGDVPSN